MHRINTGERVSPNPLSLDLDHILLHTEGLWQELRGQHLFIAGGTGFVGCWLLESLLWANQKLDLNAQAIVLTRDPAAFRRRAPHLANARGISLHPGDIQSFEFPSTPTAYVIHAAAPPSVALSSTQPQPALETYILGAQRILEFSRSCCASKLLLISSGAVYGPRPPGVTHILEDCNLLPDPAPKPSIYAEGKRQMEWMGMQCTASDSFDVTIARCFAFVGPYLPLDGQYAIGNFILDGLNRRPIQIRGDGTPVRSYLYAADLAIWLWTIFLRGKSGRAYNVGSEDRMTIADVAGSVASAFNPRPSVSVSTAASHGQHPVSYVPSTERARLELGVLQTVTLQVALARTIAWHRAGLTADGHNS